MARRRRSRNGDSYSSSLSYVTSMLPEIIPVLRMIEDRRLYRPEPVHMRPALSFSRMDQSRVVERDHVGGQLRMGFAIPAKVAVCVRRKQRREVLMAHGVGRGSLRVSSRKRRSEWSDVDC